MTDILAGVFAKLARAEEHLKLLQHDVDRWRESGSGPLAREQNARRTEFRFYTNWNSEPDATRWGLMLGDGIHNVRSALDHIVYACSGSDPPERCEFPVFLSREQYFLPASNRSGGMFRIRGITNSGVRAEIENAQPWKNATRPKYHLFWMVHELDVQDKHRLITPVAMTPQELRSRPGLVVLDGRSDVPVSIAGSQWVALENHALVMTVVTPVSARAVELNASIAFGIGVRVGDTHMGVTAVLGEACRAARLLLQEVRSHVEA